MVDEDEKLFLSQANFETGSCFGTPTAQYYIFYVNLQWENKTSAGGFMHKWKTSGGNVA